MTNDGSNEIKNKPINDLLRTAFQNKDFNIKKQAIEALGIKKDPRALSALVTILTDTKTNLKIRLRTVESITTLGDMRGIDSLILVIKDNSGDSPVQLRALCASAIFKLDLRKGIEIGLDFLINTRDEPDLLYISILDQMIYYYSVLKPKTSIRLRIVLEELFDRPEFKNSWNLGLTLAKALALYNSLLGIKYLLFQKEKIISNYKENYKYFLESIENVLEELKSHNSLKKTANDNELYKIIQNRTGAVE